MVVEGPVYYSYLGTITLQYYYIMPGFELFGDAERREVMEVLETGVLMRYGFDAARKGKWKASELEDFIEKKFNVKHAQLVSSGTTAITTALTVAGIGAGDEVIMPTFTFVASFEGVLSVNAVPVLVDVDESLTLSPQAVEAAITPRTKAVMPVHMCGAQADLDSLKAICEKHNLLLIEDACQATGASYKGKYLGTIGDLGCFSFDYVKTVTMGEGGAVITNCDDYAVKADGYADHGHDHLGVDRGADEHPFLGLNFRVTELTAAVGLAQFRRLDDFLAIQRKNKQTIKKALKAALPNLEFRVIHDEEGDNASHLTFLLPSLEKARAAKVALAEKGVTGCFHWYDNNWHYIRNWHHLKQHSFLNKLPDEVIKGMADYATKEFPQSDAVISRSISMGISLLWTEEQISARIESMIEALK